MKNLLSLVQQMKLRQIFTTFLAGITFFLGVTFGYGNQLEAQANDVTLTPEVNSYQVKGANGSLNAEVEGLKNKAEGAGGSFLDKIEDAADNVVEKLNLNEPLPPSTKKFIDQVQDTAGGTAEKAKQGLEEVPHNNNLPAGAYEGLTKGEQ